MADVPHFLHPQWLWALLPLLALLWLLWRRPDSDNPWRRVVAHNLQPLLLGRRGEAGDRRQRRWLALLGAGWLLAVLALADPVWDRAPRPVYESQTARVIVLDLSLSMLTRDLAPSRLVRARFKVEDIVRLAGEGQVGLVVFAGDAFTVTPLTRDAATLRSQLRALKPAIMPAQGSRADLGLRQAGDLLGQAGLTHGDVLLIADGVEGDRAASAASQLRQQGFRVSVLGVGTRAGAPLVDADGRSLRDANGNVVVPKLEVQALQDVAVAGGGVYTDITPDARDVVMLVDQGATSARVEQSDDPASATRWHERGPWLVLALLPLAALAFRRGWLFSIALLGVFTAPAPPAMAATSQPWDDLWQTSEQRAADALAEGDFARASALANDPLRRGAAQYRRGDYTAALSDFTQAQGADADYNRGNALARLGRYEDAIAAYDAALQARPGMADAMANKAAIEALLEQQRRREEQQREQQAQQEQQEAEKNPQQHQDSAEPSQGGDDQQPQTGKDGADEGQTQQADAEAAQASQQADAGDESAAGKQDREAHQAADGDNAGQTAQGQGAQQGQPGGGGRQKGQDGQGQQATDAERMAATPDAQPATDADAADSMPSTAAADAPSPSANAAQSGETDGTMSAEAQAEAQAASGHSEEGKEALDDAARVGQQETAQAEAAGDRQRPSDAAANAPGDDKRNAFAQALDELARREAQGGSHDADVGADAAARSGQVVPRARAASDAQALQGEERLAAEQWLRRIPDDPGGLLRRKFQYQYQQRHGSAGSGSGQGW